MNLIQIAQSLNRRWAKQIILEPYNCCRFNAFRFYMSEHCVLLNLEPNIHPFFTRENEINTTNGKSSISSLSRQKRRKLREWMNEHIVCKIIQFLNKENESFCVQPVILAIFQKKIKRRQKTDEVFIGHHGPIQIWPLATKYLNI